MYYHEVPVKYLMRRHPGDTEERDNVRSHARMCVATDCSYFYTNLCACSKYCTNIPIKWWFQYLLSHEMKFLHKKICLSLNKTEPKCYKMKQLWLLLNQFVQQVHTFQNMTQIQNMQLSTCRIENPA